MEKPLLSPGDLVPHFTLTDIGGRDVRYADGIWQRRNLVLVTLGPGAARSGADDAAPFEAARERLRAHDAECVVTRERVAGLPERGVVVADRWGEIAMVQDRSGGARLPDPDEVVEWVDYVQRQCPECQGETR